MPKTFRYRLAEHCSKGEFGDVGRGHLPPRDSEDQKTYQSFEPRSGPATAHGGRASVSPHARPSPASSLIERLGCPAATRRYAQGFSEPTVNRAVRGTNEVGSSHERAIPQQTANPGSHSRSSPACGSIVPKGLHPGPARCVYSPQTARPGNVCCYR